MSVKLTVGQYKKKTAYHIDPLMAKNVEIVRPDFFHRHNNEQDASEIMKQIRKLRQERKNKAKHKRRGALLMILILACIPFVGGSEGSAEASQRTVVSVQPGDADLRVALVQQKLASYGYTIMVDGIYGKQTYRAITHFQRSSGLVVDGIVGPQTQRAMGISFSSATPVPAPSSSPVVPQPQPASVKPHKSESVQQWYNLAMSVGWEPKHWPVLSCIIYRESRGQANAKNPNSSATGLLQILARYFPGVNLYDPETNLRTGLQLYRSRGWQPWYYAPKPCY